MFQVTCIRDRPPVQVHLGPVAVQLKLRIILGTLHMVITLTPVILSVRIKEEKATKVGMPPALLNPSKALISKSGPPHDHFNWSVMERCAEWLGLARGLSHITFLEKHENIQYCALIVRICARILGHSLDLFIFHGYANNRLYFERHGVGLF